MAGMTDRLSDERLKRLREAYSLRSGLSAFEAERECSKDAVSAVDELLDLRAKLSAGPVMPEVPSESVQVVIIDTVNNAIAGRGNWSCYGLYVDIRTTLLGEQSR